MPQTTNQIYTGRDDHEVVYPAKKKQTTKPKPWHFISPGPPFHHWREKGQMTHHKPPSAVLFLQSATGTPEVSKQKTGLPASIGCWQQRVSWSSHNRLKIGSCQDSCLLDLCCMWSAFSIQSGQASSVVSPLPNSPQLPLDVDFSQLCSLQSQ